MRTTNAPRTTSLRRAALALLVTALTASMGVIVGTASPAAAAPQTINLNAVTGTMTLPGQPNPVPILGYTDDGTTSVSAPGGPTLVVNEGDEVTINLTNLLGAGVQTSLLVEGQSMQPDLVGVGNTGTATYTFTADQPGTFLYEAGLAGGTQYQNAMGLHGAFVVLPPQPATGGQAYDDPSTVFDSETTLVLSEIDPALNNSGNPATFDMRNFHPRFFLVNGQVHPDVAPVLADPATDVLLRYVNAGITYHSMGVLGAASQTVIALDGFPLADARHYVADTIGPGQTLDSLVATPDSGSVVQRLSVYDASLTLRNGNTPGLGGMLAAIEVADTPPASDLLGPVTSGLTVDAVTGALSATADDTGRGDADISGGRAYVDDFTTEVALTGSGAGAVPVSGTVTGTDVGEHTVYVQSQDANGNWGPLTSVLVTGNDAGGPMVVQPVLSPNVTRQPAPKAVTITATGDDSSTGNSNIVAAEYSIGATAAAAGSGTAMTVTTAAPVAELTATIGTTALDALAEGNHLVWVRAQDAGSGGTWGEAVAANLAVDLHGPTIEGGPDAVAVNVSPNNGQQPLTTGQPVVRVTVQQILDGTFAGVTGTVAKAEMFIDTVGATGTGIPLTASDGLLNEAAEAAYGDIPLSTVRQMTDGDHTISVHARDAAGNWGDFATGTLTVDKTAPAVAAVTAQPQQAQAIALQATATDQRSAVVAAEWFTGKAKRGQGTAMTVSGSGPYTVSGSASAAALGDGKVAVKVRVKDQAGNWSSAKQVVVDSSPAVYFSTRQSARASGLFGAADKSDIYLWDGAAYQQSVDASALLGLPTGANVDGLDRVDDTHYYVSFATNTAVPGLGVVQDEDVVFYNDGTWSMFFNGTARGLRSSAADLDAISVSAGGRYLFFSTVGNARPRGVKGTVDDADIYRVDRRTFKFVRVFDASRAGLPKSADVDGLVWIDKTHQYLSFEPAWTRVRGIGRAADEDVVFRNGGSWRLQFDGSRHGLGGRAALDVDAFDLP